VFIYKIWINIKKHILKIINIITYPFYLIKKYITIINKYLLRLEDNLTNEFLIIIEIIIEFGNKTQALYYEIKKDLEIGHKLKLEREKENKIIIDIEKPPNINSFQETDIIELKKRIKQKQENIDKTNIKEREQIKKLFKIVLIKKSKYNTNRTNISHRRYLFRKMKY
jgi:hypothetical protein